MEIAIYCGETYSLTDQICKRASGTILTYNTVADWVNSHGEGSYLIFGTDVIPYTIYDYPNRPFEETPIFKFMERGGTVIWVGDTPFYYLEKEGKKEEVFRKANPFPFVPQNLESKPVANSENTIVGEMLGYEPRESWRPVNPDPSLIPISTIARNFYSTWIYKYGRGRFVRVYDSPYVNVDYVLSLPERLTKLGVGIRIRGYRKFKDFKLVLPKFKIGVILGKNNVGKTSILEALAMLGDNYEKIIKFRGKLGNGETELYLNDRYYYVRSPDKATNPFLLIYSHDLEAPIINDPLIFRRITELLNLFDPSIFYVYLSADKEIRVVFNDRTDVSINELGYGYKSLLSFIISYVTYNPRVILIDDLEGFSLHPKLLDQFYDFLLKLDVDMILITTQSSDVYAYLAEKGSKDVIFILLNDNSYEVLNSDEVLDLMDYEDLRFTALKVKKNEVQR